MMLLLGLGFLWSARSALLYHVPIYFKGWMYPRQAIIGGGLSSACGLFLIINGIYRKRKLARAVASFGLVTQKGELMFAPHTHKPEAYFLDVLWSGLERLYMEVKVLEKEELAKLEDETKIVGDQYEGLFSSSFGGAPNDALITNDFVWYASSAGCFLKLFDHSFDLARSYQVEFPAMLKWRDKVSAHPAISHPIKKHKNSGKIDSAESQAVSIMMHPEWEIDHYSIGGFTIVGPTSLSHADWKWSLTRIHPEIEAFVKGHL